MTNQKYNRSEIFKAAWASKKRTGMSFGLCLSNAWTLAKIAYKQANSVITVSYKEFKTNSAYMSLTPVYNSYNKETKMITLKKAA